MRLRTPSEGRRNATRVGVLNEGAHLLNKKVIACKLLTNRKLRQGAVELLKDPDMRRMLLQRAIQQFCRS